MVAAVLAAFGYTPDQVADVLRLFALFTVGDWCLASGAALVVVGFGLILAGACLP